MMDIDTMLKQVVDNHAPDFHLKVGHSPVIRLANGDLFTTDKIQPLTEADLMAIAQQVAGPEKYSLFGRKAGRWVFG